MDGNWRCSCGAPMRLKRTRCPECREQHVYDPKQLRMRLATLEDRPYFCVNRPQAKLGCCWLADAKESMCYACGLTVTTPILQNKTNHNAFTRFEESKRRLVAALLRIGLLPRHEVAPNGAALRFHLKQDREDNPDIVEEYVITGHINGDITMNIRETDRVRIEATKRTFNEKYRTTLGTLRHEVGHFFFLALVSPYPGRLERFRAMFGDETQDYNEALTRYYDRKRNQTRRSSKHVSSYAMSHPHEDWAETWAHYMHIEDALAVARNIEVSSTFRKPVDDWFAQVMGDWEHIAGVMNALNLSMGHAPAYPFRLTDQVAEKIRFVADLILECGGTPFFGYFPQHRELAAQGQE